jgi:hypothetical protein
MSHCGRTRSAVSLECWPGVGWAGSLIGMPALYSKLGGYPERSPRESAADCSVARGRLSQRVIVQESVFSRETVLFAKTEERSDSKCSVSVCLGA